MGKLCEVHSDNGYQRYPSYDTQGRLASIYTNIDTYYIVSYTYDANGRLFETTYPQNTTWPADIKTRNVYNPRGYLTSVTNGAGTLT